MSMSLDFPPEQFSHNEMDYVPDVFQFYGKMRAEHPAYFSNKIFGGSWLFFRYADCRALVMDGQRLSNARAAVPLRFLPPSQRTRYADMVGLFERWFAFHDGARHTRTRQDANRSYAALGDTHVARRIQRTVDMLLDNVAHDDFDLMSEFAFPLSAMVIADLLGVSVEAHADLTRWTNDIAHLFGSTAVSEEHIRRTQHSTRELVEFLSSRGSLELSEKQGGLMHRMRTTEAHGHRNDDRDVIAQAALLLFAGTASIRYLIGNSVYALEQRPYHERNLLTGKDTAPNAVEELLRYCNPVQFIGRVAREDFTYRCKDEHEAHIREGQPVILYIGSANRDAGQFPRADELVLTRPAPNAHLTFGAGRHLCFGDPLVRATTKIALGSLYRRMPFLRVRSQNLDWNTNLGFRGFQSLAVGSNAK